MAGNTIGRSGKTYALAALPFVGVPIEDAPLLGWALAHETVNAPYNGTASKDGDPYMGLMNGDPYTSEQQRQRDRYELNDTGWYAVEFEQINGSSKCHLALHDHWIQSHGYALDGVVNMNLPEQGISGPFRITAVQHIIPQKKPIDEDPDDEWEYRPVTGLFEHESDDVWRVRFASGAELGVTSNHPIYSNSRRGWVSAGDLEIGEEVLSLRGTDKVRSKERDETAQTVHNLEVRELHNFLVGKEGVVVHNNCWDLLKSIFSVFNITFENAIKIPNKIWTHKIRSTDNPLAFEIDFSEEIGSFFQKRIALAPENTPGIDAISEAGKVMSYKVMSGTSVNSNLSQLKDKLTEAITKFKDKHSDKGLPVDIYVKGDFLTKQAALDNWNVIKDVNVPYTANKDIIGKIFYKGPDGFIEFN